MSVKIQVTPDMVNVLTGGNRNAALLFDGDTNTAWFPGWNPSSYPARAQIDLKNLYDIEKVRFFDGTGQPNFSVAFGLTSPEDIVKGPLNQKLDRYQQWHELVVGIKARYITLELLSMEGDRPVTEFEIYGDQTGAPPPQPPSPSLHTGAALQIATNSFHWVPTSALSPFSFVREYQYWTWMEATAGQNRFEPSDSADANYDKHYVELKSKGITPIACINQTPAWLLATYPVGHRNPDNKPLEFGSSGQNPASYRYFARFLFQLAARYGRVVHPEANLTVNVSPRWPNDPPNVKKSGLDLLQYIEVWNEPDKWWLDALAKFEPAEFAAMLSACYDGHEGRLGQGHGIKTADPSMKVIMGGLTGLNTNYLLGMKTWFDANRSDKKFCSDVLNLHHYSNKNQDLQINFEVGIAPEADRLVEKLEQVKVLRDAQFVGKPIWLSEFGYDTGADSPQRAAAFGTLNAEQVQANWLVRSYLACIAAGVEKAFLYNIIDGDSATGLYQTSGILQNALHNYTPKVAFTKIATLVDNLNGAIFKSRSKPVPEMELFTFEKAGQTFVYAWANTSNETQFQLAVTEGCSLAIGEEPKVLKLNSSRP